MKQAKRIIGTHKMVKPICCNCKHRGGQFKILKVTHLHCSHPDIKIRNPIDHYDSGWDSVREIWDTCDSFEQKVKEGCPKCGSKYIDEDNNVKRCVDCYTTY